jgi:uncharacterized iron-regulated membrane protein
MAATPFFTKPRLAPQIVSAHRWLSLGAATFWLLQAITGVLIVFHWELSDASASFIHRPTDVAAIERRIDMLAPRGGDAAVTSVWTTAGFPDRYDILIETVQGDGRSVRVAGDGTELRTQRDSESTLLGTLVSFHHDLLGTWGSWIVAISGILLLSNLMIGLVAAWPRRGTWRAALSPARRGPAPARLFSWHRALGLWLFVPAILVAGTGTLLKFEGGLARLIGAQAVSLPPNAASGDPIGFAAAAKAGLAAVPGSTLTAVTWPDAEDATFRVRVRAPGEIRRGYGASLVLVDANSGRVRGTYLAREAGFARGFMSALFPIHTGEAAGIAGRILSLAVGLWLIAMIVLGGLLWAKRRRLRGRKP